MSQWEELERELRLSVHPTFAEKLLDNALESENMLGAYGEIADLVATLRAPATPGELTGQADAVSEMSKILRAGPGASATSVAIASKKVLAAVAAAASLATGSAFAAGLPAAIHGLAGAAAAAVVELLDRSGEPSAEAPAPAVPEVVAPTPETLPMRPGVEATDPAATAPTATADEQGETPALSDPRESARAGDSSEPQRPTPDSPDAVQTTRNNPPADEPAPTPADDPEPPVTQPTPTAAAPQDPLEPQPANDDGLEPAAPTPPLAPEAGGDRGEAARVPSDDTGAGGDAGDGEETAGSGGEPGGGASDGGNGGDSGGTDGGSGDTGGGTGGDTGGGTGGDTGGGTGGDTGGGTGGDTGGGTGGDTGGGTGGDTGGGTGGDTGGGTGDGKDKEKKEDGDDHNQGGGNG